MMRYLYIFYVLFFICCHALCDTTWTNTAGRVFNAKLVELTDQQATFVMTDGTTNRIAITALSPECQAVARRLFQLPAIPPVIRPTFDLTVSELRRIHYQYTNGKLDAITYNDFQRRFLNGFRTMYIHHQLPQEQLPALEERLLNSAFK
jgi:hypothetical protein